MPKLTETTNNNPLHAGRAGFEIHVVRHDPVNLVVEHLPRPFLRAASVPGTASQRDDDELPAPPHCHCNTVLAQTPVRSPRSDQ